MNQVEGLLLLTSLPLGLLLVGYWLPAMLDSDDALDRVALALPAGLATVLATVAVVNFYRPLSGFWAYLCLAPALIPLLVPAARHALRRDLAGLWQRRSWHVPVATVLFFAFLLWPVLLNPHSLFYDGTSNHDSFFWISAAEHLKRHTYMELPVVGALQPLTNATPAIIGWQPDWGRMGAEGLLAMASSAAWVSPLKLYLYATASLFFVWIAAVYLAYRTFYRAAPGPRLGAALVCLQPVFVFFYGNANLPNLLGTLTGTALVIGTQRALVSAPGRGGRDAYLLLIALSFHGVLCAYPEIVPFVLLPVGLLWLRHWSAAGPRLAAGACSLVAATILFGAALNGVTLARAVHGFIASFTAARADQNWANLFNPLVLAEYLPGLATLSIPAARDLGPWLGWPMTGIILLSLVYVFRQARDRLGLLAVFSGSLALLAYTIVNDFAYGWQKSVQFAGVFYGMVFPVAALDALNRARTGPRLKQRLGTACLVGLGLFLAYASFMEFREVWKWSDRKVISADWFTLREQSRTSLRARPVLVDAATFRMPFFHGMWATYFLDESHIYYGARGEENGGYLRDSVLTERQQAIPSPAAYLVGRAWADVFEAGSPRLLTGREFVLLGNANRVYDLAGVFPLSGLPHSASGRITVQIKPIKTSTLRFELAPQTDGDVAGRTWRIHRRAEDGSEYASEVGGAFPWRIAIPLVARQKQTVTVALADDEDLTEQYPFKLSQVQITRDPAPLSPVDGRIDFTAGANWEDYHLSGLDAVSGTKGIAGGPGEAVLEFAAQPAEADVELELVAEPLYQAGAAPTPLPTELWLNDSLIFTGFFSEPGVLRARIFSEHWNQVPVGRIRLRFPNVGGDGPRLLLKSLSTRRTTSPRP